MGDTVLPSRTGKACWERWIFRLDPSIDRSPFTPELDAQLLNYHSELGNKWAAIAKRMSKGVGVVNGTRTADQIKSRFISLKRVHKRNSSTKTPKTIPRDGLSRAVASREPIASYPQMPVQVAEMDMQGNQESEAIKRERSTSSHLMHPLQKQTKASGFTAQLNEAMQQQQQYHQHHFQQQLLPQSDTESLLGSMLGEMSISAPSGIKKERDDESLLDLEMLRSMDNFLATDLYREFGTSQVDAHSSCSAAVANSAFNGVDSDLLESVESQLDHIFGNSEGVNLQPQAGSVGHNMGNRLPLQQHLDQTDSSISSLLELSI